MLLYREFKKINKMFLLICIFGIFLPILYSWLRVFWIAADSSDSISMASIWIYVQIIVEAFSAILIFPLFSYSKENKKKSPAIFSSIFVLIFVVFLLLLAMFPWLFANMSNNTGNTAFSNKELKIFLLIAMASSVFKILEKFLVCDIIVERNSIKGVLTIGVNMSIKIFFDLLLLSVISPFEFNLIFISVSSLLASLVVIIFLTICWVLKYNKVNDNWSFSFDEIKEFYKKGIWPGAEVFVRNLCYFLVTLSILSNLPGGQEGNPFIIWSYGGLIYWFLIIELTNSFRYSLLSERVNNKEANLRVLTNCYILIDLIIFIVLTPLAIKFMLPLVIDNDDPTILEGARKTAWALSVSMFFVAFYGKLSTKFMTENKYIYMFIITVINALIISLPVKIFMIVGGEINYIQNLIIFELGIFTSAIMAYIFYDFTFLKESIEKLIIFKKNNKFI